MCLVILCSFLSTETPIFPCVSPVFPTPPLFHPRAFHGVGRAGRLHQRGRRQGVGLVGEGEARALGGRILWKETSWGFDHWDSAGRHVYMYLCICTLYIYIYGISISICIYIYGMYIDFILSMYMYKTDMGSLVDNLGIHNDGDAYLGMIGNNSSLMYWNNIGMKW